MSFSTVTRDIEARLVANWSTTAIDINENTDFDPPAYDVPYVKLRILEESTRRVNIGNPAVHRSVGTIAVQVFTPTNTGTRTGQGHAETIGAIFHDQQFNGITCREALVTDFGEYEGRWQTNVLIPFYWDGRHSV